MKRRHYLLTFPAVIGASTGCSTVQDVLDQNSNCSDFYRETTINEITQEHQDASLTLAGKVTDRHPTEGWVFITDGTGTATVDPAPGDDGEKLWNYPESKCLEFRARVGSVTEGGDTDVTMYLGELVKSANSVVIG